MFLTNPFKCDTAVVIEPCTILLHKWFNGEVIIFPSCVIIDDAHDISVFIIIWVSNTLISFFNLIVSEILLIVALLSVASNVAWYNDERYSFWSLFHSFFSQTSYTLWKLKNCGWQNTSRGIMYTSLTHALNCWTRSRSLQSFALNPFHLDRNW